MPTPTWQWLVSAVVCAGLLALPLLVVTVAPITDLPQQVAQMRLLHDATANADLGYRIQWWHPNKLGYLPLYLGWKLSGPAAPDPFFAGRLALVILAGAWVFAIHGLARAWGRSLAAAMLASVFFFNHITYWGFISFLCGVPVFLLWLRVLGRDHEPARPPTAREVLRSGLPLTAVALLLYSAHVLWLAVGLLWLICDSIILRRSLAALVRRGLWSSPALALVAVWYPRFAASGFDSETHWGHTLIQRLHPDWLVPSALGGLHGSTPKIIAAAVVAWVALGLWSHRRALRQRIELRLVVVAGVLGLLALLLPGVHQHTIFFASRWLPAAALLMLLGAPPPAVRPALRRGLALLLVAALTLATANAWLAFERVDLDGFLPAVTAVPGNTRLLGLDFVRQSPRIRDYPFYHLYAYAQARGGGLLNRSFADQASSLVVFRELPKVYPWTRDLDWQARHVRETDLAYFDHVLVFATRDIHSQLLDQGRLVPMTPPAPWRLYRVHAIEGEPAPM